MRLAVSAGIAIVRDDSCDGSSRGALACVDHHHELHEAVVHRWTCRLYEEDVAAADRFLRQGRQMSGM